MRVHDETRRAAEWQFLHDRITEALDRCGKKDMFGHGDYLLLDDDWGHYRHELEIQNLKLLEPLVVKSLQALLIGYPDWEISMGVDVVAIYKEWPPMGIIVRDDGIVDCLQRQYLPKEFQEMAYEGRVRRPVNAWDIR